MALNLSQMLSTLHHGLELAPNVLSMLSSFASRDTSNALMSDWISSISALFQKYVFLLGDFGRISLSRVIKHYIMIAVSYGRKWLAPLLETRMTC